MYFAAYGLRRVWFCCNPFKNPKSIAADIGACAYFSLKISMEVGVLGGVKFSRKISIFKLLTM